MRVSQNRATLVFLAVGLLVVTCDDSSSPVAPGSPEVLVVEGLLFEASIDSSDEEGIHVVRLLVTNVGEQSVQLSFRTFCPIHVRLLSGAGPNGHPVWDNFRDPPVECPAIGTTLALQPNQVGGFDVEIRRPDLIEAGVSPGTYRVLISPFGDTAVLAGVDILAGEIRL